jgi:hypothetical protein
MMLNGFKKRSLVEAIGGILGCSPGGKMEIPAYHTLKNDWVFEDSPNFVLAS